MAISKTSQYSAETLRVAAVHSALAHPARIMITELVSQGQLLTNKDLTRILNLSEPTVHFHLKKLAAVNLVEVEFKPNFGIVKLGNRQLKGTNTHLETT